MKEAVMKQIVGGGREPSIQEQLDALDRRWNELVYGPYPPPRAKPAAPEVLMVPVSQAFASMVRARPETLRLVVDGGGNTRVMERPTGPVKLDQGEDFAKSLANAIQRNEGKKDV
jgi:hypothetical protein